MLIELPLSLETTLNETAQRRGVTAESLVLQAVQDKYRVTDKQANEVPFNYDLERMQTMMQGLDTPEGITKNSLAMPKFDNDEDFLKWIASFSKKDMAV